MKKNIILFSLTLILSILLLYFILNKVGIKEILEVFSSLSLSSFLIILILTIVYTILGIWRWKVVIKGMGFDLPLKDVSWAWLAGFGVGYLFPILMLSGEAIRAYIVKKEKKLPWKEGIISIFIDKIFEGTVFFLIIILGVIFFIFKVALVPAKIWIFLLIMLFPIGAIIFFYSRAYKSKSIIKFIQLPLKKFIQSEDTHKKVNGILDSSEKIIFNFF